MSWQFTKWGDQVNIIPQQKRKKPPAKAGEYRIRDKEGNLTYVGETNNLVRRMYQHGYNGKMSGGNNEGGTFEWKVADGRTSSFTRREHEKLKIKQHNSKMNLSKGGEGRTAKKRATYRT